MQSTEDRPGDDSVPIGDAMATQSRQLIARYVGNAGAQARKRFSAAAEALARERYILAEDAFVDIAVWRVPRSVKGSTHRLKYRLALVVAGECVLRYDNETGEGDHRHVGDVETPYSFSSYKQLLADFWTDVDTWRKPR